MNIKRNVVMALAAAVVAGAGGLAGAAEPGQAAKPGSSMSGMGDMSKGHGMMRSDGAMGGDMMGMMDMMHSCQKMMGGAMSGSAMMPQLPPGNEKLEFQMHAEMMQKMGEIAARYADKIKETK